MGLIAPAVLILGAVAVLFVTMNQVLYPMCLAITVWITGDKDAIHYNADPHWSWFSGNYTAFVLYAIMLVLCSKKDIKIFMKLGSYGVIFIVILMIFIIYTGIKTLTDTNFKIGSFDDSKNNTDWETKTRTISMFYSGYQLGYAALLGSLCAGYFLHTCSLSIVRNSANPEKNSRDVFISYLLVFISYAICGVFGYIGYIGYDFKSYFLRQKPEDSNYGLIDQNCLLMYDYYDVKAFVLRLSIFLMIFTTYPLVAYFLNDLIIKLFFKSMEPSRFVGILLNVGINTFPLICALFIPHIATLLGIFSTVAGYLIIYVLPVFVYLKHQRTKLTNPLLAEALVVNEFKT